MTNKIITEGKTSTEAIEIGLKQLHTTREKVEIKVLEEEKRNFFSILTPRTVKVELCLKETENEKKEEVKTTEYIVTEKELNTGKERIETFLQQFFKSEKLDEIVYSVKVQDQKLNVFIEGKNLNYLIGYRGEVLNAFQSILSSVVNRGLDNRCRVVVDIEGYRKKREKTLEELAEKIAKTVMKTNKAVTLEPMSAFERKVIHSKLQNHPKVKTYSVGEEPYRKIIISLK